MKQYPTTPTKVEVGDTHVKVTMNNGRVVAIPLADLPWLRDASPEQQSDYSLRPYSVIWNTLDDGFDVEEMLEEYGVLDT